MKKLQRWLFRLGDGRYERPDPRPMRVPVGMERPESLQEKMRRLVRDEVLQAKLAADGVETFEEADDFDIPDDPIDPATPYEERFDPKGMTAREQEVRAGYVQEVSTDRLAAAEALVAKAKAALKAAKEAKKEASK